MPLGKNCIAFIQATNISTKQIEKNMQFWLHTQIVCQYPTALLNFTRMPTDLQTYCGQNITLYHTPRHPQNSASLNIPNLRKELHQPLSCSCENSDLFETCFFTHSPFASVGLQSCPLQLPNLFTSLSQTRWSKSPSFLPSNLSLWSRYLTLPCPHSHHHIHPTELLFSR